MLRKTINIIKKIASLFEPRERWQFLLVMLAVLFMALFQALGVASILPFMNMLMQPEILNENKWLNWAYTTLGFQNEISFIFFTGFILLIVIIIGNLASAFTTWLTVRFVARKRHNLSVKLLRKYLSLPYAFFLNRHSADLSKNVLAEVDTLTGGFIMPFLTIITKGAVSLLILLTLILVNPVVTLLLAAILGGSYALIYFYLRRKLIKAGKLSLSTNTERFKAAEEALGGIKDIKVLGREHYFIDKYNTHSRILTDLTAWHTVVGQLPRFFLEIVTFGGIIALILIFLSIEGNTTHVIPTVSFFAFAGYRLMPALQELFNAFTNIQFHKAIFDRIYGDITELSVGKTTISNGIDSSNPVHFQKCLELTNICYAYPNTNEPVLNNINLRIEKNTSVAIAGSTGSGKTTLADLLLGLLTPQQGDISVDGVKITEDNTRNWQRNLGYVPQFIYLCDDTITRNIAFGLPENEINIEQVKHAAQIANLHDFIEDDLPNGYDTWVGERGIRLSGGQRQRVGIARALYHDPEVLVLDEATSSLDGITEDAVLHAIENASKLKTVIIIAHRLTTVKDCDMIYLIDKGRIADRGTYENLMETSSQFRDMAKVIK